MMKADAGLHSLLGKAAYKRTFHQSRLMCCEELVTAPPLNSSSCVYELHPQGDAQLFRSARAQLAGGRSCITYQFLTTYSSIIMHLLQLVSSATLGLNTNVVPGQLITSAALHSMKTQNATSFRADVDAFVREVTSGWWVQTAVLMHTCAAPNASAIVRGGFPQTEATVAAFNNAMRHALAAARVAGRERNGARVPSLVDYYAVTADCASSHRFHYLDEVHFRDSFYQTNFVVDALVLNAEVCTRNYVRMNSV